MQGKECSRKGPTIRIRVNLQGMDLSRKSRNLIRKEWTLQGMRTMCVYHSSVGGDRRQYLTRAFKVHILWRKTKLYDI